jgi:hypothetical protein
MPWTHKDYKDAGWYRITVRVPLRLKQKLQSHTHEPLWMILWKHFFPNTPAPNPPPPSKAHDDRTP